MLDVRVDVIQCDTEAESNVPRQRNVDSVRHDERALVVNHFMSFIILARFI